nr:MAG: hypothetical protein [Molluscum contagiosum virus]
MLSWRRWRSARLMSMTPRSTKSTTRGARASQDCSFASMVLRSSRALPAEYAAAM